MTEELIRIQRKIASIRTEIFPSQTLARGTSRPKKVTIMEDALVKSGKKPSRVFRSRTTRGSVSIAPPGETPQEKTNKLLKAKLVQFQYQNAANIETAKKEIEGLKTEIKKSEENNQRLIAELENATKKLQRLIMDDCKAKSEQTKSGEENSRKEELETRAREFRISRILKKGLKNLAAAIRIKRKEGKVKALRDQRMKGKSLHSLKRNALIGKVVKYRAEIRNKQIEHRAMRGFVEYVGVAKKGKHVEEWHLAGLMRKGIKGLLMYPKVKAEWEAMKGNARNHYLGLLQQKFIFTLKTFFSRFHLSPAEEQRLSVVALRSHLQSLSHKTLIGLCGHVAHKKPAKVSFEKAVRFRISRSKAKAMTAFKLLRLLKMMLEKKADYFRLLTTKRGLKKSLMALRVHLRDQKKKEILDYMSRTIFTRRFMGYWKRRWDHAKDKRDKRAAITKYANEKVVRRVWRGFGLIRLRHKKSLLLTRAIQAKHLLRLRVSAFHRWARKAHEICVASTISEKVNDDSKSCWFRQWRERYLCKWTKRVQAHFADILTQRNLRRTQKQIFRNWKRLVEHKKTLGRIAGKVRNKLRREKMQDTFRKWERNWMNRIKDVTERELKREAAELAAKTAASESLLETVQKEAEMYQTELEETRKNRATVASELASIEISLSQKQSVLLQRSQDLETLNSLREKQAEEFAELERKKTALLEEHETERKSLENYAEKLKTENEGLEKTISEAEKELKVKQASLLKAENELLKVHSGKAVKGDYFGKLEEVAGNNKKLMIELERKKKELAELEAEWGMISQRGEGTTRPVVLFKMESEK